MLSSFSAMLLICSLAFAGCADSPPLNQASSVEISPEDIQYHIDYLASDELEGRLSGTPGCDATEKYVAAEFERLGLAPRGEHGSYFQEFDFTGDVNLGQKNVLRFTRGEKDTSWSLESDFIPAGFSASAEIETQVVFAGYGITAEKLNYNDYENLDVEGKVVLILHGSPDSKNPHSGFSDYEPLRRKALQARQRNALALLVQEKQPLPKLRFDQVAGDAGLPVVFVSQPVTDWLLAAVDTNIDSLRKKINDSKQPNSSEIAETRVRLTTQVEKVRRIASNVIGYLPGTDPELQKQSVIVGAHHDHLGRNPTFSRDPDAKNQIRNGADDNASGTAGVLELAQFFSQPPNRPKRSLVFMTFAAEELGLLGSSHFVAQPTIPLESTVAMINMDMIGRMKDSTLIVQGVGTSPSWPPLLERSNSNQIFDLKQNKDGQGASDHASFYKKEIPVLFFFTGIHDDYHKASDDAHKINTTGETLALEYIANIITEIANADTVARFTKAESERRQVRSFKVSVGTIPDYAAEVEGVKLSGVRKGGAADRAGLQAGDVIIKFGHIDIKNIYDYTFALGEFSPGDEIDVIILREGNELKLRVKLDASRRY